MTTATYVREQAGKAAFRAAQSVYWADHDHFPLTNTWEGLHKHIREGWRRIADAALAAALPPDAEKWVDPRSGEERMVADMRATTSTKEAELQAEIERLKAERCSTCEGRGTVDERHGGQATSNPAAPCPDCEHGAALATVERLTAESESLKGAWEAKHASEVAEKAEAKKWFDAYQALNPTVERLTGELAEHVRLRSSWEQMIKDVDEQAGEYRNRAEKAEAEIKAIKGVN